jgi:hypothetical protein
VLGQLSVEDNILVAAFDGSPSARSLRIATWHRSQEVNMNTQQTPIYAVAGLIATVQNKGCRMDPNACI